MRRRIEYFGGAMRKEIECVGVYVLPDGREIPAEFLSDEEKKQAEALLAKEINSALSDYFTLNPE